MAILLADDGWTQLSLDPEFDLPINARAYKFQAVGAGSVWIVQLLPGDVVGDLPTDADNAIMQGLAYAYGGFALQLFPGAEQEYQSPNPVGVHPDYLRIDQFYAFTDDDTGATSVTARPINNWGD